jgi:hypothetical protein
MKPKEKIHYFERELASHVNSSVSTMREDETCQKRSIVEGASRRGKR